jgi:hypothetical protein
LQGPSNIRATLKKLAGWLVRSEFAFIATVFVVFGIVGGYSVSAWLFAVPLLAGVLILLAGGSWLLQKWLRS